MARHSVDSTHEPVRHVDDHDHDAHDHDTILHHSHAHDEAAPPASTAAVAKLCTLCGENVAGRKRYKDRAGHYYCEDCFPLRGDAPAHDSKPENATRPLASKPPSKRPPAPAAPVHAVCPDCHSEVDPSLIVDFHGAKVCASCAHTRELSAKREAHRIAAAEDEAHKQAERRKMILAVVITVVVLGVIYGVMQVVG